MIMMDNKNTLNMSRTFKNIEWEAVAWAAGLLVVATGNPDNASHFSLFPQTLLFGIRSPGYGLGHSIALLFHGRVLESIQMHPLGIVAVVILVMRIIQLSKKTVLNFSTIQRSTK